MHLRINVINGEKHPAAKWPCLSQVEKISASLNLALKSRYFLGELYKTIIRMSRGTGSLTVASQGLSRPFLKTFTAVFPDPTDRPWVSKWIKSILHMLFTQK